MKREVEVQQIRVKDKVSYAEAAKRVGQVKKTKDGKEQKRSEEQ